jgi:ATP-dependent Clp protease protease subunit
MNNFIVKKKMQKRKIQEQQIEKKEQDQDQEIKWGFFPEGLDISNENPAQVSIEYLDRVNSRKIYLFDDIEKETIVNIIYQVHVLEQKSNEDIEIVINSDGGIIEDCLALVDVMNASPCDFKTTVLGLAASAACLIASNGTFGKRYAGRNSEFMFHEVMEIGHMAIKRSDISYLPQLLRELRTNARKYSLKTQENQLRK